MANLKMAKGLKIAVGLPEESVSGVAYGGGLSVIDIGYKHEYGVGVPRRSFLEMPILLHKDKIEDFSKLQFRKVFEEGVKADQAIGLLGLAVENIIGEAFDTEGWGQWQALSQKTIENKGSSKILTDTGLLRQSIGSVVRG
jgi:hypothetical protein